MSKPPIFVAQPSLPPLDDLIPYLEKIWASKVLTNGGPFHQQLEDALCEYLGVPFISLFSNGTIALITALKALDIQGEVITTPYSFVATAHSLLWNGITPVFVDVDPLTLNLDPNKIEVAITARTRAILPVHVYGHPCDVEAISAIAEKHQLKVVYDAAHAFGVKRDGASVLTHGDLSVLSFHATKVFNTMEGGAIVCKDLETKRYIDQLKNFGFASETMVVQAGINGKLNEVSAALGLLQLLHIDRQIEKRRSVDEAYREGLKGISGIRCHIEPQVEAGNYSYFPVFIEADFPLTRDTLYEKFKSNGINGRRYFYPLITGFPMYRSVPSVNRNQVPVALDAAEKVLCLPIYETLSSEDQQRVLDVIASDRGV